MERYCEASVYFGQLSVLVDRGEMTGEKAQILVQGMLGKLSIDTEKKEDPGSATKLFDMDSDVSIIEEQTIIEELDDNPQPVEEKQEQLQKSACTIWNFILTALFISLAYAGYTIRETQD